MSFAEHHARQDEILDDANYQGHARLFKYKRGNLRVLH